MSAADWRRYYAAFTKSGLSIAGFYSIILPRILTPGQPLPAVKTIYNRFAEMKRQEEVLARQPDLARQQTPVKTAPSVKAAAEAVQTVRSALASSASVRVFDLSDSNLEQAFAAIAAMPLDQADEFRRSVSAGGAS